MLTSCFSQPNTVICPQTVLNDANDTSWIGLPWVPDTKLTYDRNHIPATCDDSQETLYHFGGRYYLSTEMQNIELSTGPLLITPLSIYHIPCNETHPKLKTGFGTCPKALTVSVPIFQEQSVNYVQWNPPKLDSTYELHYNSLNISPPLKFNKTVINALDKTFERLDGQLHKKIKLIYNEISSIKETQETEAALIIGSVALGLAGLNSISLISFCCCFNKVSKFLAAHDVSSPQPTVKFEHSTQKCLPPNATDDAKDTNCEECNKPLDNQPNPYLTVRNSGDEHSDDSSQH